MRKKIEKKFATKTATKIPFKIAKIMVQYQQKHEPRYIEDTKRPYISFYAFDEDKQKFVRVKQEIKKGMSLLDIKNKMQEIRFAQIDGKVYEKPQPKPKNPNPAKKSKTLESCAELFLKVKKLELKIKSVRSYTSHINMFVDFCKKNNVLFIKNVTQDVVKNYLLHALEIGNSNRNRNNKRIFLRTFFNYLVTEKIIKTSPIDGIPKIKQKQANYTAFQKEHIKQIWENFKTDNLPLYYVTKIIFYAFIRPAELVQIKIGDVDFETKKITVKADVGKTGLGYISITPPLFDLLKEIIQDRKPNQYLIAKENGEPYSEKWFSDKFLIYRRAKKYPDGYKLYGFKHTGVKEHFLAGNTLSFIQKQCRHSEIRTTLHYLEIGLGLEINPNYNYIEPKI